MKSHDLTVIGRKDKKIVDADLLMHLYPGKGGWTYVVVESPEKGQGKPFRWVRVKGSIDGYPLKQYKLMPMAGGKLFLPVRKDIRKKIGKEAGKQVHVILFHDDSPLEIPHEIRECFDQEKPELLQIFLSFTESEQKAYLDWIYEAKSLDTRTVRILKMMARVRRKLRLYDKEPEVD